MRTYRFPTGGLARALRHLGALVFTLSCISHAEAQERRYLFEVGAAGGYQSFADSTHLGSGAAGLARIGVWLPLNFSLEAEGSIAKPSSVNVRTTTASVLYNVLFGSSTWGYAKLGYGGVRYGASSTADCQAQEFQGKLCGTTSTFVAGLGVRLGLTPTLLLRAEGVIQPNRGDAPVLGASPARDTTIKFTNFGLNVGVSLMLGSKPIPDSDGDGILNNRDRCAGTPAGAQVDGSGCPVDSDGDGVPNGVDRCPNSGTGALVDADGCSQDSDGDNIADGVDKCADTPAGVLVDSNGCPRDSDGDSIADGLDRCSNTPKGATVDALGCPGDEDGDGALDGLDRCPRTPAGASVNTAGCAAGQQGRQPPSRVDTSATRQQQPRPQNQPSGAALVGSQPMVLEGVAFGTGSARLQTAAYVELDSIAKVLVANPNLRVEIGGHTDEGGTPADNMHLSNLRAEAVRNYLVAKGVPFQQMVARGYGSSMPRTPDTTPRGRAANRRIEIRPIAPGL